MSRRIALTAAIAAVVSSSSLFAQIQGPSTGQTPYQLPSFLPSGVKVISIASNGPDDASSETFPLMDFNNAALAGSTRLLGIPDGMGAYDNGDGTFSLVLNHEISSNQSTQHAHGSRGAVITKWIIKGGAINPSVTSFSSGDPLTVIGSRDGNLNYNLWNTAGSNYQTFNTATPMPQYAPGTTFGVQGWNFSNPNRDGTGRYCSGDLALQSAFRFGSLGTDDKIYLTGEEIGKNGRAFAHVLTGADTNTAFQLPMLGKMSFENVVASPFAQNKTVLVSLDDSSLGDINVYVGTKTSSGTAIERAGLTNGSLYGLQAGIAAESQANVLGTSSPLTAAPFSLYNYSTNSTVVANGGIAATPGATIGSVQGLSQIGDANGVTDFRRPEDGAWDPAKPNDFYWLTTAGIGANSRIWKLSFTDILNPEIGGQITMVGDGSVPSSFAGGLLSNSTSSMEMADNMTAYVGNDGKTRLLIQEDVGGDPRLGRIWQYNTDTDTLVEVAISDSARFTTGAPGFLTLDEETSGIIPAPFLNVPGDTNGQWFLMNMQAHYGIAGELVQGSQLMAIYVPDNVTIPEPTILGTLAGSAVLMLRRRKAR